VLFHKQPLKVWENFPILSVRFLETSVGIASYCLVVWANMQTSVKGTKINDTYYTVILLHNLFILKAAGHNLDKRGLQSWTKPFRPFQLILQSYWTLTKQTLSPPPPPPPPPPPHQFNVVNNAKTTFGNIPWHKLNIELGERGLKKGNMIQHGVYHKNVWIFYRGKIVSTSYVQDCLNVGILHACQLFECYG
jgi:hypothetical protein